MTEASAQDRALHRPRQARSRATLDRILAAACRLLERRNWSQVTVADLAREADSSVGSVYARFRDKDAILDVLDERYARELMAYVDTLCAAGRRDPNLATFAHRLVTGLARFHRERRGLLRALILRARLRREPAWDERTRRMNTTLPGLIRTVLRFADEIRHPDPERAAFLALTFTFTALRERILFPESIMDPEPDRSDLDGELERLFTCYLGADPC